jgi:uncharacterized membrane protein
MKRIFMFLGMAVFSSILFVSCSKGNGGDGGNTGGTGGTGGGTPGPLFNAVKAMMQTNCAVSGCHAGTSPQNGLNFSVDNTIVAQKDRIKVRAVDNAGTSQQMPAPPNAPLSETDRKKITDWVSAGGRLTD